MRRIRFHDTTPDRVRKRLKEIESEQRFRSGIAWRATALFFGFTLLGLVCMALGMMSTSATWGPTMFWLGVLTADIGFALTLVWAFLRLER